MEKRECSSSILSKLDLDDIEEVVWEPYHKDGPGRPPRNPVGIFKVLIIKRLRQIPSDRELCRRLWNDPLRHRSRRETLSSHATNPIQKASWA